MDQGVWRNGSSGRGEEEQYVTGCLEHDFFVGYGPSKFKIDTSFTWHALK
jgi:hypothetical protein